MAKKIKHEFFVVLDDGSEISLKVPEDHDEFWKEFMEHSGRGFYHIGNWSYIEATYKGFAIDNINMSRVVGYR